MLRLNRQNKPIRDPEESMPESSKRSLEMCYDLTGLMLGVVLEKIARLGAHT